ncbi:MAG: hypothetical protein JO045_30080 [Mycobacterium sp.]|nr:hypothetical protein [Mycobacterium sp.]
MAVTDDAERAIGGRLVGLALTVGDNLGDLSDFDLEVVFRLEFIIYLFIAIVGNGGQLIAKSLHAVESVL